MGKSKNHILIVLFVLWVPLLAFELFVTKKHNYKWVFVYYMSYDNDLGIYGNQILRELAEGLSNDDIAIVMQVDYPDDRGMKRISRYYSDSIVQRKNKYIKSEDSADTKELEKFLDWVRDKWKADNYCVVFTNHGGLLNDMCKDENPTRSAKKNKKLNDGKWLPSDKVGTILAEFNRSVDGKIRLLFLQQCGKAQIQSLYSFTDTCEYLMASPVGVGAPNTYYTKMVQEVSNDPNMTGEMIAQTIMREDKDYTIYTLLDCNELKKLPEKIEPVLNAFTKAQKLESSNTLKPLYEYGDEIFYDFKSYFQTLSSDNNDIAKDDLQTFLGWCDTQLIETVSFKNYNAIDASSRSGLSIYVPSTKQELSRYDFLPIYKQTNLKNLIQLTLK